MVLRRHKVYCWNLGPFFQAAAGQAAGSPLLLSPGHSDLDNLSDLLGLIHLVFFFPPPGSAAHELVTCVYLATNSSYLDSALKLDIYEGSAVRFQCNLGTARFTFA